MRWLLLAILSWLGGAVGPASAHPVPRENHDRTIVLRLTPEAILVDYRLELDETRAALDLSHAELARVSTRQEFYTAFTRYHAPILANNLVASLDGKPLVFTCVKHRYEVLDHLRCDFHFRAAWTLTPGKEHALAFREGNYELDDFSMVRLTLEADPRLHLRTVQAPEEAVMARPPLERKPGDGERIRKASASFVLSDQETPTIAAPVEAPEMTPSQEEAPSRSRSLLHLLLDTEHGEGVLLLLAACFGAVHALTPGHGKTLVAAYLIGERGTVWHALLLGLVTTLTHTAGVLILAFALAHFSPQARPASIQAAIGLLGGLLVAGLGCWLLLARLSGRADHVHLGGGHHHHHHHQSHSHEPTTDAPEKAGWWRVVVLGMGGGIIPCWDAIAMLCLPISADRVWLAPWLVLSFSAGLAAVLIALGIGIVCTSRWAGARWGDRQRLQPLIRALPILSALVITGLGLWLCYDSVQDGLNTRP
jgi:ABC-type nickel/cobalt efflux system permease component RcnA